MLIHKPTGKKFINRKEAKMFFGTTRFNRLYREKQFILEKNGDNK